MLQPRRPVTLRIVFDAAALDQGKSEDARTIVAVPDDIFDGLADNPARLMSILLDALLAGIRACTKPGEDLIPAIDSTAAEAKQRVRQSTNDDAVIIPLSALDTTDVTCH